MTRVLGAWLVLVALVASDPTALLEQLRSPAPAERRAAAERLAEVGGAAAIPDLARALRDADPEVRAAAQAALWAIWHRSGDAELDRLLQRGILVMEQGAFAESVAIFSELIARDPAFAEGWNKRATAYYLLGEYDRSLADCEEVIRRNPIHFGALSGFGLNFLQKGDLDRAARYFEEALAVNPNLTGVEAALEQIRAVLRQRRQRSI